MTIAPPLGLRSARDRAAGDQHSSVSCALSTDVLVRLRVSSYDQIYAVVRQIPAGCVATYGQVATLAGLPGKPRLVGYALYRVAPSLTEAIPWHRVVNARGEVSMSALRQGSDYLQRHLLEAEGIEFDSQGRLSLHRYRWQPDFAPTQSRQCPLGRISNANNDS